jgi:REP element-mobilizing transposase RayT
VRCILSLANIRDRIPIFKNQQCCLDFFEISADLRTEWPAKVIAYVLMPEHFHFVVNPRDGDIKGFVGTLKIKLASKIIEVAGPQFLLAEPAADGSIHQVWQESFKVVPLWSSWMIWQKINYIHANPVKARLVNSAKDYPWSSFGVLYNGASGPLTVDQDWWWPDDSEKLSKAMKQLGWRTYHYRKSEE